MKSISIKAKLIRMQVLLAFLLLTAASSVFLLNDIFILKKSVEGDLQSTTRILAQNLAPTIAFSDQNEAKKILSSLQSEMQFATAQVYDRDRKIFAEYVQRGRAPGQILGARAPGEFNLHGSNLSHCYNIEDGTEALGLLCISTDLSVFWSEYRLFFVAFALVLLAGVITSFFLANWIQRSLSRPIMSLADTAKEISRSQNYSLRMTSSIGSGIEEIDSLSGEFNQMLNQIEVSDQKIRLEKEVAEAANQSKSLFLANISHELRTPMHGILSFAKFGQQKIDTAPKEKLKSYFDEIHESGARLMSLLNDLLDLSKLESGKTTYTMSKEDLTEVALLIQSEIRAFAEENKLKIELIRPATPVSATFDREKISQVLRNIVSNSIKFSNAGTTIEITLHASPEHISCSVTNLGLGIPESELKSIFEKFVQSSKTKTGAGGTGLGLSICKEIVRHHNGRIWAENLPNGRTCFVFELPREQLANLT